MEWRADLIRQNFMPQDVEAILSIPHSANGARDRLIWARTKNGKFSMRSAYKMAQEGMWGKRGAEPSNPTILRVIWRHIWEMNIPNKLKHFAWKACKNILATKENLKRRNITNDSVCEACEKHSKSICHIFRFCDKAKEV
ncbi:putative ribonuclease h protein [Quercus suber]|uniref:Ribonuclease h protein n=1 Tax=Quercus suber TaxID=58331 RepID=A0AAW0JCH6_QUESU